MSDEQRTTAPEYKATNAEHFISLEDITGSAEASSASENVAFDAPLTADELEALTGAGGCAAHNLPANASRKEKMDACASCSESGCGEREVIFKDSPKKWIISFIGAFAAVSALCLFMQYVLPLIS